MKDLCMKANIRSANPTTTNHATHEIPQHDYTQKFSAVPGQANDLSILDPQKVVAPVLPSVRNYEDCLNEVCPVGLLGSLTNRSHEGASTEPSHIEFSVRHLDKS